MFILIPVPRGGGTGCVVMGMLLSLFLMFPLMALFFSGFGIYTEYKKEAVFRQSYGADWKEHFDEQYGEGAAQRSQSKIVIGGVSVPVVFTVCGLFVRQLKGRNPGGSRRRRRRSKQKDER